MRASRLLPSVYAGAPSHGSIIVAVPASPKRRAVALSWGEAKWLCVSPSRSKTGLFSDLAEIEANQRPYIYPEQARFTSKAAVDTGNPRWCCA